MAAASVRASESAMIDRSAGSVRCGVPAAVVRGIQGVLGIKIRTNGEWAVAVQLLLGIAGLALITSSAFGLALAFRGRPLLT